MVSVGSTARQERTSRILEAAITVLATQGARNLTHRRVDKQAGLPQGTTSHFFSTSAALSTAVLGVIAEREAALMTPFLTIASVDDLVAAFRSLAAQLVGPQRELAIARHAIFFEQHATSLLDEMPNGADALQSFAVPLFAGLGAENPQLATRLTLAAFDGAVLQGLVVPLDAGDVQDVIEAAIRAGFPRPD